MQTINKPFVTSNYSVAAALLTKPEVELIDVESNITGGHQLLLTPHTLCKQLEKDYELNRLIAPAKQLATNIQMIKNFVRDRLGGQK